MTIESDYTFDAHSLYGSTKWVAATLGRRTDWVTRNAKKLEKQGFPAKDALVGLWIKSDVKAWINARRKIYHEADAEVIKAEEPNLEGI